MHQIITIVSGGGSVDPLFFQENIGKAEKNLIICCDGGLRHCLNLGISPDLIIGDMDSVNFAQLENRSKQNVKIIKYPTNKDRTDTELALDYALRLKPEKIFIWCALGGRIDHTLANVFLLLKGQKKRIPICLIDEYCEAFVLEKEISFLREKGKTVSLLALTSSVTGITLSGFVYPLVKGRLRMGKSLGMSNIINKNRASIKIEKGKLLIIKFHKKNIFPEAI